MTGKHKKDYRFGLLIILAAVISGCIFSSSDKNGKKPAIISLNIKDGQIINTRDLLITWEENEQFEFYQYSLDGTMYDWTESTYVYFTDLNENGHIFTIQALKDSVFSSLKTINFTIDAIQGPGIVLTPRKISGDTAIVIRIEDVTGLMAAHVEIVCNDECASITGFVRSAVNIENGQVVVLSNYSDQSRFILDIGFGGATEGMSGSFDIGYVFASPVKETGMIIIDDEKTEFRDFNNNTVELNGLDMVRIEK